MSERTQMVLAKSIKATIVALVTLNLTIFLSMPTYDLTVKKSIATKTQLAKIVR